MFGVARCPQKKEKSIGGRKHGTLTKVSATGRVSPQRRKMCDRIIYLLRTPQCNEPGSARPPGILEKCLCSHRQSMCKISSADGWSPRPNLFHCPVDTAPDTINTQHLLNNHHVPCTVLRARYALSLTPHYTMGQSLRPTEAKDWPKLPSSGEQQDQDLNAAPPF